MEDLSFNTNTYNFNDDNIGGPNINSIIDTDNLSVSQKHAAYTAYTSNNGYILFDFTLISNTMRENEINIINNTSFFVFFLLFLLLLLFIIIAIIANKINPMLGLYLLLIFSTLIYMFSVLYRSHTLSQIHFSTNNLNTSIAENKREFDNSIINLPNHVQHITSSLT